MQMIDIHLLLSSEHMFTLFDCDVTCQSTNQKVGTLKLVPGEHEQNETPIQKGTSQYAHPQKRSAPQSPSPSKFNLNAKVPKSSPMCKKDVPAPVNPVARPQASTAGGAKVDVSSMMSVNQNMSTNETAFKCLFCDFETAHKRSITRHIEIKHLPSNVVFNCVNCGYTSKFKHDLLKHYISKHDMPKPAAQAMLAYL